MAQKDNPDLECWQADESGLEKIGSLFGQRDKNNIDQDEEISKVYASCPNSCVSHTGAYIIEGKVRFVSRVPLPCNQWSCPYCREKKRRAWYARFMSGSMASYNPIGKYEVKMLTLTCPGLSFRMKHTPKKADIIIKKRFNRFITYMKREFPDLMYLWVVEPQRDGFPHLHVAFVGSSIVPMRFYKCADYYWRAKCQMGFTYISAGERGVNTPLHALNYMIKYLGKGLKPIRKFGRVFGCTRGVLATVTRKIKEWEVLYSKQFVGDRPLVGQQEVSIVDMDKVQENIPHEFAGSIINSMQVKLGYGYYETSMAA